MKENSVFLRKTDTTPLFPAELFAYAQQHDRRLKFADLSARTRGEHCRCTGMGEFVLDAKVNDTKAYMTCRICGAHSHL
jgi:hypothetical protein